MSSTAEGRAGVDATTHLRPPLKASCPYQMLLNVICNLLRLVSFVRLQKQHLGQQQHSQEVEQSQQHQEQKQQYQRQQQACAATTLKVFDLEGLREGTLGTEKGHTVSHAETATSGGGLSSQERGSKAQRRPEAAEPSAASGSSEGRKLQYQQGYIVRQGSDTAAATAGLAPSSSVQQQKQQHQRSQRPQLNSKTSGVFIAFKHLAAAAAAGAAVATKKRSAATSGSGQQSQTERQQHDQQQCESLPPQQSLLPFSRSSAPSNASEQLRVTHAVAGAGPEVAAAAAAASTDAAASQRLAANSGCTSAACPPEKSAEVGLPCPPNAGKSRRQGAKAVLSAACSRGSSAVWLMQRCYSLGSCTVAENLGNHKPTRRVTGEAIFDAATAGRCHCVASRMPVLLRDAALHQWREQQQQKTQGNGETGAIPVLQQQLLLLCCTEGNYPVQLRPSLQLRLQYHLFRGLAAEGDQNFAPEGAAALDTVHLLNGEKDRENLATWRDETTPVATNEDIATKKLTKPAAGESGAAATDSLAPTQVAVDGKGQKQHELQLRQEDGLKYLWLSAQSHGEPFGQQKQRALLQGEQPQPMEEKQKTEQEQQPINQQGELRQHELSSRWGRKLVSWTWRRLCMRQRQPSRPEVAAAAVAAAALCYRPPAGTSLALQLLLLLLPHDVAVRLLADTNTAQCQRPRQRQQPQQLQQDTRQQMDLEQQGRLCRRENLGDRGVQRELHRGTCTAPVKRLTSGNGCPVRSEGPGWQALEFSGITDEAEQQQEVIDRLGKQGGIHSKLQPGDEPQHGQPARKQVKEQKVTEEQQETDWPAQKGKEMQEGWGCQQVQERPQDAQPIADPQPHGQLKQEQRQQDDLRKHQQKQQKGSSAAVSTAPAVSAAASLPGGSQGPSAKSALAVGGVFGAPQLYGRGFVQGEQLPASFLRLHFNFASLDAGARVIASSSGMQHIKAVQRPDADTYMLVPCYVPSKYFVLSFSETLKIDFVVIQSFEMYANAFWHIQLLGADTYPTRQWRLIANLQTAADVSSELFDLKSECAALSSCWAKFLKVRLLTHHDEGPHYYCSLTSFQVFGATGVQFLETQIHDEFGEAAHGAEGEVFEGVPYSSVPLAVGASAVDAASGDSSAAVATKDARETVKEISLPLDSHDQSDSLEVITQQLGAMQSAPVVSNHPQSQKGLAGEREAGGVHDRSENTLVDDAHVGAPFLHGERQRSGISVERQGIPPLDEPPDAAAIAAVSADSETESAGQRVTEQHQRQRRHNVLRVEEVEKQNAAALNALSGALEKALQQQQQLLKQKRQRQQQEPLDLQHDVLVDDPAWLEMGYPSVPISGLREVLSLRSSLIDSAVCTASNSANARSVWQGHNPLIQPTTSRYICMPMVEGTATTGAAASVPPSNKPSAAHQVHLVAAHASPGKSSKQLQVADAATEALRQAAAYARAFLLDALRQQQQQPQLQQTPINAAFLRFLMTTTAGEQDQQAETLRVLSLLLQPPTTDVSSSGGGVSGEATRGGMAAAQPLGPRDTKGEHVLVMLLERMKSLEGEAAAFKAAAAERQQQLQLQQQHLLHLALLVQLQQQLGSFLFERLAVFDGLIPHLNPLVQLLDESELAATSAAAAAQEEEMLHGTVPATSEQHINSHCSMMDENSRSTNSSGQQQQPHRQQQHCRHTARHQSWAWPWDASRQQLLHLLDWLWRWLAMPLMHWGSDVIFGARVAAQLLQQLFCSDSESAVVQQSCAAASSLYRGVASVAGRVAYAATVGADIACRGISTVAVFVAATWIRLFAALNQPPPPPHDWSTGSSSSGGHWTERFLVLQERASSHTVDASAAISLLLFLVCILAIGSALFWRLIRGHRVAAAAAGECALLRRSFELLQRQHQALEHQLQQHKREQQLLLLLAASHHGGKSSRMLLHRTKYEAYGTDAQQRQRREVEIQDRAEADFSADILRIEAAHQGVTSTEAPEPFASPLTGRAKREAAVPDEAPSLLRRLSTSLAPRVFLGLSRNAGDGPHVVAPDYGSSSSSSSNPSADNAAVAQSPRRDSDAWPLQRRESMLQQKGLSGTPEQQTQQEQQVQFAAAALLPALDTKAIRSLKLQRHTLRQRRQGGAATPMASPAAAAVADGDTILLSPSVVGARVSTHTQNAYMSSGAEASAVITSSAAPSRSCSSRSSSVGSTSGNLRGTANSYLKSLWTSQLTRSGTVPHVSLSWQPIQRQVELNRAVGRRDSPDPQARASSNLSSSSSSASGGPSSVAAASAPSQERNVSYNMPMSTPVAGRGVTGGQLAGQLGTGAEGEIQLSVANSWLGADTRLNTRGSNSSDIFACRISARDPVHGTEPTHQQGLLAGRYTGFKAVAVGSSLLQNPDAVSVVFAGGLLVAHGQSDAPDVSRRSGFTHSLVCAEANENAVTAPVQTAGPFAELQQTQLLKPQQLHLQAALASSTGRDGRRRRKKRGAS
ncbi:hypothetical protein, conserved [Eimeria brunetti]|uniref:SUN domain-containing protein n=1 Tax=Eimeria brunetti TaxID=51314 RepID=U6LQM0_9EIME|nr:hypothetical protein, conserved [Eimeria brunetti]